MLPKKQFTAGHQVNKQKYEAAVIHTDMHKTQLWGFQKVPMGGLLLRLTKSESQWMGLCIGIYIFFLILKMTETWSTSRCPRARTVPRAEYNQVWLTVLLVILVKSCSQFLSEGELEANIESTMTLYNFHIKLYTVSTSECTLYTSLCHFHWTHALENSWGLWPVSEL